MKQEFYFSLNYSFKTLTIFVRDFANSLPRIFVTSGLIVTYLLDSPLRRHDRAIAERATDGVYVLYAMPWDNSCQGEPCDP